MQNINFSNIIKKMYIMFSYSFRILAKVGLKSPLQFVLEQVPK